ncbi:MAG: sulfite exporter TauE/SafE family protein [Oscillospiraceae bacterium]|nr:sulfite exporter TauE/SafE family protein [Oscillospiraceae bacterium]
MMWLSILAGAACGVLSGFGIGGGSLLMVYMTALLHMEQRTAQAINLLFFLPTAAASLIFHVKGRQVQWRATIPAVLAGLVAAAGSAWAATMLDAALLRRIFGVFLLFVGVSELLKKPSKPDQRQQKAK